MYHYTDSFRYFTSGFPSFKLTAKSQQTKNKNAEPEI